MKNGFAEIIAKVKECGMKKIAVAAAQDDAVLEALEDEQLLDEVFAEFCHQYEDFENNQEAMELDD